MGFNNVVCVFVLYGSFVTAFPTGDCDGIDLGLLGVPVEGTAEFNGTVPASGSCIIFGHSSPELLLDSNLPAPIALENDHVIIDNTENINAPINPEYDENYNNGRIPNKIILGAILADAIMAEKGAEIDATLVELDKFVETEIEQLGPLIQNALTDTDTSAVDRCVDTALHEIESKITSEIAMIDEFIESELTRAEKLVESIIENTDQVDSHFKTAECRNDSNVAEIGNMSEKEALVALEVAMLESLVESQLAKTESLIDCELEKVNSFIESELAKVDDIVESELAKVDLFVETELAKTDNLVKSELSKMESFVETELARVEVPVEGTVKFSGLVPASGATSIIGSCDYVPVLPSSDVNVNDKPEVDEDPIISSVEINGTFPVTGRTLIFGSTGCPPILPTAEPLPLYVESFPVMKTIYYDDSYEPELVEEVLYDDVMGIPVAGEVAFSGVAPAEGRCKIVGVASCDPLLPMINRNGVSPPIIGETNPLITKQVTEPVNTEFLSLPVNNFQRTEEGTIKPQIAILPLVNVQQYMPAGHKLAFIEGNAEFSGTAKATGRTSFFANFPCPPLTATEEGPDGKKYIWISKKSFSGPQSRPAESKPRPDFPTYTADFPETIIMDATKNYEKLMSEDLDVDIGLLGPIPVTGEAFFEGTAPAFESVSIRGHSA